MNSLSAVTSTRVYFGNSIHLFDYQKSWGLKLNRKGNGLLERALEAWVIVPALPFTSSVTLGKALSEPPSLHYKMKIVGLDPCYLKVCSVEFM